MAHRELRVPVRYYLRMGEVLARHHLDMGAVLRQLGLPMSLLSEPDATIRVSQVEKLVEQVTERTGRTDLGYDLGKLLSVSTHSVVGFGMLSSATVDQALAFQARYFRLVMPSFRQRYTSGRDFGELHFTPTIAMSPQCLAFHMEAIATAALREVRDLIGGPIPPARLTFSMPEPLHRRRYNEQRAVKTEFGVERLPGVRLRFSADLRAYPLTLADANALSVAEERCRSQVTHATNRRQFADWIAMTLRGVGESLPTLIELASMLSISPRTLNRYLEREGTTYQLIVGRVRHELACERLSAGDMNVSEVAYSLGFTDVSNFARAFRARAQCSPRDYRKRAEQ
ncbi:MAG: AraC family transcriptional regulator [Panacagrimonas sp.]